MLVVVVVVVAVASCCCGCTNSFKGEPSVTVAGSKWYAFAWHSLPLEAIWVG